MEKIKYNEGWSFWNAVRPEEKIKVTLPHDAMLTEKRLPNMPGGAAVGYFPGGKYYYEKEFIGKECLKDRTVMLEFQGVYMKSTVLLNGEKVGGRIYGYSRFYVDLTGKIRMGEKNVLQVIVDNTQTPNSRWYSGSGIYRDVYLLTANRRHIAPDAVFAYADSSEAGLVHVETDLQLKAGEHLDVELFMDGKFVGSATGKDAVIHVAEPQCWSEEEQPMYELIIRLYDGDELLDSHKEKIGLRTLTWDAEHGIQINEKETKLRGGCIHHDNGILGACSYYEAELRRVKKLKELGFNAIRYSHNPAGQVFLDACDEAGMYVIVEAFDAWKGKMLDYDYGMYFEQEWKRDLKDMILAARNHPSVIMYCIGNEISDTGQPEGAQLNQELHEFCHAVDPTRPTMHAFNPVVSNMGATNKTKTTPEDVVDPYREEKGSAISGSLLANMIATVAPFMSKVMGKPEKVEKLLKPCYDHIDIVGYNYSEQCYEPHHKWNPDRIMVGSETYPGAIVKNWPFIEKHPYVIGDFMWTAWDYLGEAGIGVPIYGKKHGGFNRPYPCISGGNGAFNLIGEAETPAYIAAIVWGQYSKPYIAVRPVNHSGEKYFFGQWRSTDAVASWSWTGMEGRKAEIEVYSRGSSVELIQDGKSLGQKPLESYKAVFQTVYKPGKLVAVSYDAQGDRLEQKELISAVDELELRINKEEPVSKEEELIFFKAELTDKNGIRKLLLDRDLKVQVEGAGELLAVGSSNPVTEESYLSDHFTTHLGVLQIIVRRKIAGRIKIRVTDGTGLQEEMTIQ